MVYTVFTLTHVFFKIIASCIVLFLFSFTSLSSLFTHIETNQSESGAKTGVPGEKLPDTPASRTWLVLHVNSAPCEARTNSSEMIEWSRALKSATLTTRPRGPPIVPFNRLDAGLVWKELVILFYMRVVKLLVMCGTAMSLPPVVYVRMGNLIV